MLEPVVCFTCKWPLEAAPIFWEVHKKRAEQALKEAKTIPPKAAENLALQSDNSQLFADLGIHADCCRMHVLCGMRLELYY